MAGNDNKIIEAENRRYLLLTVLIITLIGAVVRLIGAWWMRLTPNGDFTVVNIMAKRMMEGSEFPVFFYGQAYMGSFEPAVSAIFCKIFGYSSYSVCLGTVVFGIAMLPFLYLWGRDTGGIKAGIIAMLLCLIGPMGFFHYQCSSRGGYAVALFACVFVLWMMSRVVMREREGAAGIKEYALLGLVGGVAWWSNQIVTPAILSAALIYAAVIRFRCINPRSLIAVIFFFGGSAPFWVWNYRHDWMSLSFITSATKSISIGRGFKSFVAKLADVYDISAKSTGAYSLLANSILWAGSLIIVIVMIFAVWRLIRMLRSRELSLASLNLSGIVLFLLLFIVIFCRSNYAMLNTPRYLLIIIPAMAVLTGSLLSEVYVKLNKTIAVIVVVLMVGWHSVKALDHYKRYQNDKALFGKVHLLDKVLEEKKIKAVYTSFDRYALNYLMDERYCFSDLSGERYQPYMDLAETQDDVSYLNGYGNVSAFLDATRSAASVDGPDGLVIFNSITAPSLAYSPIATNEILTITDINGNALEDVLMDGNSETVWKTAISDQFGQSIIVDFSKPVEIGKIRLVCRSRSYPLSWKVYGKVEGDKWESITPDMQLSLLYWSGPRPYFSGAYFRLECNPLHIKVRSIRIIFPQRNLQTGVAVSELQIFKTAGVAPDIGNMLGGLIALLGERKITRLYADRWLANAVKRESSGRIWTSIDPWTVKMAKNRQSLPLQLDHDTAILVEQEDADYTRRLLNQSGIYMRESEIGTWVLFDFDRNNHKKQTIYSGLNWIGFGPILADVKKRAYDLYEAGLKSNSDSVNLLRRSIELYPNNPYAYIKLAEYADKDGDVKGASRCRSIADSMWKPKIRIGGRYSIGMELVGISFSTNQVKAGESIQISYLWKCDRDVDTSMLAVFVHFKKDKDIAFQDDHPVLQNMSIAYQPYEEVFVEERSTVIPKETRPGVYRMWCGIYDSSLDNYRFSVKTDLKTSKRAIEVPYELEVVE